MRKLIGKIRRQPKQRRANIAFGIAASFTVMVVAIWSVSVPDIFTSIMSGTDSAGNPEASFFDQISSQAAAVKESIGEAGSTTDTASLQELMDGYRASSTPPRQTQSGSTTTTTTTPSTPTTANEPRERFTTESEYEPAQPRAVRIQTVTSATTSATTSE